MGRFRTHGLAASLCLSALAPLAYAGGADGASASANQASAAPTILVKHRTYTLADCLALADRNHPNLWAARARVANYHALLDEARWTPYSQWSIDASLSSIRNLRGAAPYTPTGSDDLNTSFRDGFNPWFRMGLSGGIPLYTFGKIDSIARAAVAQIRYGEWESEKFRQQVRMDVRRAFYGVMFSRDVRELFGEITAKVDKSIDNVRTKLAKLEANVDEAERYRLEIERDRMSVRASELDKGENTNLATLRFMTGVQSEFDIPHEHLERPETPIGPVVSYLTAARLFRPEVNQARAGLAARKGQLDFAVAKLYPIIAIGGNTGFTVAPSAITQNGWAPNPYNSNGIGPGFALVVRWPLDLMPGLARVQFAESQLEEARSLNRYALGGTAVEVESAYGAALEARQREGKWAHAEQITKKWLEKVQSQIDGGGKEQRDIMDPLRMYYDSRINHLFALVDYNVALSELARASGWDSVAPAK